MNLQLPCPYTASSCMTLPSVSCRNASQKLKPRQNNQNTKRYPKPSPTPLLTRTKSQPQTKLEALETVVKKLETSVKNGIELNDPQIFSSLLETCFHLESIDHGIRIHKLIPQKLVRKNAGISSKLLRLYATNGYTEEAHRMFDHMPRRNLSAFVWNSLISGYAEKGSFEDALAMYFQMVEEGIEPDQYTFPRALKACGGTGSIQVGEELHRHVIRYGSGRNLFVMNALVDMYAKCGDIAKARKVFDNIVHKDLVSWNSMILGYLRHELVLEALDVFREMMKDGNEPDSVTISAVLASALPYRVGTQVHGWVLRRGVELNLSVANSLIVWYSREDRLEQMRWLFENMRARDIVSWNSIIAAHSKEHQALMYFEQLVRLGSSPDGVTFVSLLSACAHLGKVKDGEMLFSMMRETYHIHPLMEHYACMVNLYARAGSINEAYDIILNRMEVEAGPTVWGALLYGCYLHGNVDVGEIAASKLFELEPDNELNFELLMKIYQNAGRLDDSERVRGMMIERGLDFL